MLEPRFFAVNAPHVDAFMFTLANDTNVHSGIGWARPLLTTFRMCLFGEVHTDELPAAFVPGLQHFGSDYVIQYCFKTLYAPLDVSLYWQR